MGSPTIVTQGEVSLVNYIRILVRWRFLKGLQLAIGKFIKTPHSFENEYRKYKRNKGRMLSGKLTEEELSKITKFQVTKVDSDYSARSKLVIQNEDLKQHYNKLSMQTRCAVMIDRVLRENEHEIKTVVNIGGRTDTINSYFASKYGDKQFISVDLQPNLATHNSLLPPSSNWHFVSGYALNLMQKGKLKGDLVYMTSTSVLFNSKELDDYISEFSKFARFVCFNEAWWPRISLRPLFKIERPEEVDPEMSFCAGRYLNYHHNYISKLTSYGFEIGSSTIYDTRGKLTLQIDAKNSRLVD